MSEGASLAPSYHPTCAAPQGDGAPTSALLARALVRRLRAGLGGVLRTRIGAVGASITRLIEGWRSEREGFMKPRPLGGDYVYVWVDGIHTG